MSAQNESVPPQSVPLQSVPPGMDPRTGSDISDMSETGTGALTRSETSSDVLQEEEAARAASFGGVVAVLSSITLVFSAALDKTPPFRRASVGIALAILASVAAWVRWRARDPRRYSRVVFRVFSLTATLTGFVFIHYLGIYSPVWAIVVLGFAFFGQADDVRWLYPLAAFNIITFAGAGVVVALGLVPDRGIFVPEGVPTTHRLTVIVFVTSVIVTQLVQARLSRKATLAALQSATDAARTALTNEAQLAEARENLDVVIKATASKVGRFSGSRIGRFHLHEVVGRGAMGEVYAATVHPDEAVGTIDLEGSVLHDAPPLGRAAVKLMIGARDREPGIARRFLREAEIAARVRGPNLVHVYGTGMTTDGSMFIAMELLEGRDLSALLRERNCLSIGEVLTLVDDVARGLDILHRAGVVHRDLKPQNLFLSMGSPPSTCWKILDYGISKLVGGESTLTMGQLVGTPGYMSPEQVGAKEVDHRSDVFALGAVAYRALTGRRPFAGANTPQILYQVVYGMPVRPREIVPHLHRDVELVIGMAIAKAPAERFESALSFATALRAAASGSLDASTRAAAERAARSMPWSHDPITMSRISARRIVRSE